MRHAKSDWDSSTRFDFDRPLSKRGNKDAPRMAGWLKNQGYLPDKIVSSPACRAKQTAYLIADELGISESIVWDESIYEASMMELLTVISDYADSTQTLMLIGHNPGLDYLLQYLCLSSPNENNEGKLMTTAAIAILNYGDGPIITGQGSAELEVLMRPKEL